MAEDHSTGHIIQSLVANSVIALGKGVAAFYTGSGAMLAETLHSAADCGNQLLLLLGVKRSRRPPTEKHPLGYGRVLYFWSFMVAMLLFCGGGVFSMYEGYHKLHHPEPITLVGVGVLVLLFSLAIEGYATYSNFLEINKRRGTLSLLQYLRQTKDSDLVVVFGENLAATLGLLVAIPSLVISWLTGDPSWDSMGTLAIGAILIVVAVFLAVEVQSLLVGESADPEVTQSVHEVVKNHPAITGVLRMLTVQEGPGKVLLMLKLSFQENLTIKEVCAAINAFEVELRQRHPEISWSFVEPDENRL